MRNKVIKLRPEIKTTRDYNSSLCKSCSFNVEIKHKVIVRYGSKKDEVMDLVDCTEEPGYPMPRLVCPSYKELKNA